MVNRMLMVLLLFAALQMGGCAAIANRNLQTESNLSQALFLNEECLSEGKPIYVKVRNQSGVRELDFEKEVIGELRAKGYKTTKNAKEANHELNVVFVALEKEKEGMTAEGALVGGFGGAVLGDAIGDSFKSTTIGGVTGALAGAALGTLVQVDRWFGVIDVQIKERVKGTAKRQTVTAGVQGDAMATRGGTKNRGTASGSIRAQGTRTEYNEDTDKIDYYTRIVVTASKTGLQKSEATAAITDALAHQVANFF